MAAIFSLFFILLGVNFEVWSHKTEEDLKKINKTDYGSKAEVV